VQTLGQKRKICIGKWGVLELSGGENGDFMRVISVRGRGFMGSRRIGEETGVGCWDSNPH